ncbi:MAG: hypothetical protein Q4C57_03530, partial [Bacillota bacterium]|nr:hypothetical protein [Bacillota bacterium]
DLETLIANAQKMSSESTSGAESSSTAYTMAKKELDRKISALVKLGLSEGITSEEGIKNWYSSISWGELTDEKQKALEAAYGEYRVAVDNYNNIVSTLKDYGSHQGQLERLEALKDELTALESKLAKVSGMSYTPGDSVEQAKKRLNEATTILDEKTDANKQTSVAYQNRIANAEAALKTAQAVYDLLKEEQTVMLSDINAELDLAKASKDISEKEEEIAKLKEKSMGAAIKAPVAGTIVSMTYVAGETTKPEEAAAVIQVDGKGFTLTIPVTNEQAKKVQVGDVAELQNSWYYEDAQVILSAIKADPDNPGQKKLLVFNVTGASIQNGQSLSISVGQRSSEYEFVVPNSAMREDNNGKFILIVESKSSPLGNRYIATRVDVEVLASDDNNTAISAPLYGYEYVITTSTKPVEAGKQVRLNE